VALAASGIVAGALNCAPLTGLVRATLTPVKPVNVNTQFAGIVALNAPLLTATLPPSARLAVGDV